MPQRARAARRRDRCAARLADRDRCRRRPPRPARAAGRPGLWGVARRDRDRRPRAAGDARLPAHRPPRARSRGGCAACCRSPLVVAARRPDRRRRRDRARLVRRRLPRPEDHRRHRCRLRPRLELGPLRVLGDGAATPSRTSPCAGSAPAATRTTGTEHGTLGTPVQNAHSGPIEELSELGIAGGALFLAVLLLPLWLLRRTARAAADDEVRSSLGPVLGILLDRRLRGRDRLDLGPAGGGRAVPDLRRLAQRPLPAARAARRTAASSPTRASPATSGVAQPARPAPVWLGLGSFGRSGDRRSGAGRCWRSPRSSSDVASDRLAEGDLDGAAKAARAAAAIEPWALEPSLRLAEIELTGHQLRVGPPAGRGGDPGEPGRLPLLGAARPDPDAMLGNDEAAATYDASDLARSARSSPGSTSRTVPKEHRNSPLPCGLS